MHTETMLLKEIRYREKMFVLRLVISQLLFNQLLLQFILFLIKRLDPVPMNYAYIRAVFFFSGTAVLHIISIRILNG